jgi:hypothetical protein
MLTLPGSQYLATHSASVLSILGAAAPPVQSYGSRFQNKDRWTVRCLIQELCSWSQKNPNQPLTDAVVCALLKTVHATPSVTREITIAATPEVLSPHVAMALIGGAYHESWHTLYGCRKNLPWDTVHLMLLRWGKIRNGSLLSGMLLDWSNIIEDIRIERCGNKQFPGALPKMYDLQNFILEQEKTLRDSGSVWTPYHTLQATFRDAGLGYVTSVSRAAFKFYRDAHPDIFNFVTCGPLRSLLNETISLSAQDDLSCLRVAIEVVILLSDLASKQTLSLGSVACPQCGAPPSAIVHRPHTNTLQPLQICTVCGHVFTAQTEKENVPVEQLEKESGPTGQQEKDEGSAESYDEKVTCEEGTKEGTESSSEEGGTEKAEEAEKAEKNADNVATEKIVEAEGSFESKGITIIWPESTIAQVVLEAAQRKDREPLQDFTSAMETTLQTLEETEQSKLAEGEDVWRPFALHLDRLLTVPRGDADLARRRLSEARQQTAFLQARLRNTLLARRIVEVEHGARKGTQLSARNLVSTQAELLAGETPKHAFTYIDEGHQVSFAAVLLVDQSGSMTLNTTWLSRCLFTLALPLDLLKCPLCIAGFQVGRPSQETVFDPRYHRYYGVDINIFKDFTDTLRSSASRMVNIQVSGGTPMADGIQFGFRALQNRTETHRVLFVLTDGLPERGQLNVIRWQQRNMQKKGVHCIGVGVGERTKPLRRIFSESLWTPSFEQLPQELLRKLSKILNPQIKRKK